MLTVSSLRKVYNGRGWKPVPVVALDNVSLELSKGESLGVLGESGSGKTTLGRLISRLIEPTVGRILFEGSDIGAVSPASFVHAPQRRLIQHIFQDAAENLTPHMTVYAAIADPLRRLMGLSDVESRVHELAAQHDPVSHPRLPGALLPARGQGVDVPEVGHRAILADQRGIPPTVRGVPS